MRLNYLKSYDRLFKKLTFPRQENAIKAIDALIEFIKTYFKNETPKGIAEFKASPFHLIIADALKRVIKGECNRLIINIPP